MAIVAPPPQPETKGMPDPPEVLFPEARRRRRRRWMIAAAIAALCAAIVGVGLTAAGGGTGHGGALPVAADRFGSTAPGSAGNLVGGRWSTMAPPRPGSEKTWQLAAWTGKWVIAWGSANPCCTTAAAGSSEHGGAFDPASNSWRPIPPAPVNFRVESTIWTGRQVLVWGFAHGQAAGYAHNVLWGFDPATWRWTRLAPPLIGPRSNASLLWSGTRLIVIGGQAPSAPVELLSGATYDPKTNKWSLLPAIPRFVSGPSSKEEAVALTPAWAADTLYVWVTRQISQPCGADCRELSARVQALRWSLGSSRWTTGPTPPDGTPVFNSTPVTMGAYVALFGGSSCLPEMSCPARLGGTSSLLRTTTGTWSSISSNVVLGNPATFTWTGRRLVAVNPYLTSSGYIIGGYASSFDPAEGSWQTLPTLPVPTAPPSGPVITGTVWAGTELIDSGLILMPGHRPPAAGTRTASPVPVCPPIKFPEWVGGTFCGPPPGPGNGNGLDGSCLGSETAPPCGPGMVAGRYYAYTLINSCTNDYIDGRWWSSGLQGGSGSLNVWISVDSAGNGAGWIGPNGAVGFKPSTAASCS